MFKVSLVSVGPKGKSTLSRCVAWELCPCPVQRWCFYFFQRRWCLHIIGSKGDINYERERSRTSSFLLGSARGIFSPSPGLLRAGMEPRECSLGGAISCSLHTFLDVRGLWMRGSAPPHLHTGTNMTLSKSQATKQASIPAPREAVFLVSLGDLIEPKGFESPAGGPQVSHWRKPVINTGKQKHTKRHTERKRHSKDNQG